MRGSLFDLEQGGLPSLLPLGGNMPIPFRHSAGFGRRMEYWLIGRMLREGLDVYVPLVDDFGIDAVIRKANNQFVEVQIKARSHAVLVGDGALFAAIDHPEVRENYYFVFYSERLDAMWIMSSQQLIEEAFQNKSGKNAGKRSIKFNGIKQGAEYPNPRYDKYRAHDFAIFREVTKLVVEP
jgi:hypothetical protein